MSMCKAEQLEAVLSVCRNLGAEVRYHPEYGHLTAMLWDDWANSCSEEKARNIQNIIKEKTAQYPNLVCYCFDAFSTLVYAV